MVATGSTSSKHLKDNVAGGRILASPLPGEEIVISGLSGAFPESRNVYELKDNLFNKKDMVTTVRRWNIDHPEIPSRAGTLLNDLDKFDIGFFGVHERQGHSEDVMIRLFQEKAIEAIFDAGINPLDLENTKTGVFVGVCFSESEQVWFRENVVPHFYAVTGTIRSMIAHRLSYLLKLKGPSYVVDTACSSTSYALEHAYRALRAGEIDNAIVGGSNICLQPFATMQFNRYGLLSTEGCCKAFDESGSGYVRSEGVGAVFLQKSKNARRIYAHLIHAQTNCDGYTEQGLTYPSGQAQMCLLNDFYEECSVDRFSLSYLEAHGTGTKVGDPEECTAIDKTLTENRKTPLLIGSVKSNMGHTEPVSGFCSVAKCIIAMESGLIPPNIHYNIPRPGLKGIIEGRLKVVSDEKKFEDDRGLIGINSFGFGGANCHLLLHWNEKKKLNYGIPTDDVPRLVCVSGRTEEGVISLLDELGSNSLDAEYVSLLHNIFRNNIKSYLYRGYSIVSKVKEIARSHRYAPGFLDCPSLCIVFGELNNWYIVGSHLMELPAFADSIERFQNNMPGQAVNILDILLNKSSVTESTHIIGCLAVQIGIIDILKLMDITCECFGYSLGNLLTAYYNGVIDLIETIKCGLILNNLVKQVPQEVNCKNDNMVNGAELAVTEDLWRLTLMINKSARIEEHLLNNLRDILKNSWNSRSSKLNYKSVDNFITAILRNDEISLDSLNSIVFKIGESQINECKKIIDFPSINSVNENYLTQFLKSLGRLYEHGYNPQINKLYPPINLPVSRGTRMISPLIKWKHRNVFVPLYKNILNKTSWGIQSIAVTLQENDWTYLNGHMIDGRNLFPATGYLYLVWEAMKERSDIKNVSFEMCRFIRTTSLPKQGYVRFYITIQDETGNFEIVESDSIVVTGRIRINQNVERMNVSQDDPRSLDDSKTLCLSTGDIYKELRLRGYHYSGLFRGIEKCNISATEGLIKWQNNWVTFIDNMLQMKILPEDTRLLYVPICIERVTIDIEKHLQLVEENQTEEGENLVLPVSIDRNTGVISSVGIQINGLIASSINRKKDMAIPLVECYKFIPNFACIGTEESVRVNIQIMLENIFIYKVQTVEVIDEFTRHELSPLSPIILSVLKNQPLTQPLVKILSKTPLNIGIVVEDRKLSTENNPMLIVASNLLERPKLLQEALSCLNDNGYIISREPYQHEIQNHYPNITVLTVHKTPSETLLLLQKQTKPKIPKFIRISSTDYFSWISPVQEAIKKSADEDIVLYSEEFKNGIVGLVNCLRKEPGNEHIKCVLLDNTKFDLKCIHDQLEKNMAINVFKNGQWGTYRHLLLNHQSTIDCDHCFANVTVTGDLSSIRWIEGPLRHNMTVPTDKQIVYVYYAALNFRDIMTVTGKINVDVVTKDRLQQECIQGLEYSGRDKSGKKVMGIISHGALSNLVLADPYLMLNVPDSWSMEEAATVPVVYATVLYAMVVRGQLKQGETILIHSGSGGIGQAAIRLALHYRCKVFTTVGTQEKRDFIKETYPQIEAHHIGNSRDESFEQMILKNTNGRGVDVVLNSLAEDKLIASVRCLARGGRFLEIGKFDLANNNHLNLLLMQKTATFHGVMLDQLFNQSPEDKKALFKLLSDGIHCDVVKPLNHNIFKCDHIEQAFRFMATGKHIGKVLVQMRQPEKEPLSIPSVQIMPCTPRYLCDPEKSYVIIGGLGGFGLELTDWLILRGATKFVLVSRRGISNGYQNLQIRKWLSYGVTLNISNADVTTEAGCQQLIEEAIKLGPIQALFNLAVILEDAIFENQSPAKFVTTFGPKATATQYLDKITRDMCPDLREFVVFSSVSCGHGNAGQTNYGMANSVMERICEDRKRYGYPALAIQWGAVGEVGLVAEMQENNTAFQASGTIPQNIANCLQVLDILLKQKEATIVSSIVIAEKEIILAAQNIVGSVLNILGIDDEKSVSVYSTLPELGMDSMAAVEIKQTLEREYDIFLSPKAIIKMTLASLKELQQKKSVGNQPQTDTAITKNTFGLEMVFREIGEESESCIPYIRLESKVDESSAAPKILLFPGIEGFAKVFESFTLQLNAHTICMQYLINDNNTTIGNMAKSLMPYVWQHLAKGESFLFVAYSYGTLIALEIASILESHGHIGSIICIDGAPQFIKEVFKTFHAESKEIFETDVVCRMASFCVSSDIVSKNREEILKCSLWEERLEYVSNILKEQSDLDINYHKKVANAIYQRINAIHDYVPLYNKLKSNIKLCKPTHVSFLDISKDYGLSQIFANSVDIETFEGHHSTILQNESLTNAINTYVNVIQRRE